MNDSALSNLQINDARSPRKLARALKDANLPEAMIRELSPQSLYLAIRELGIGSSTDIILAATDDQVRVILDFDLWQKDSLNEDSLWRWLELSDTEDGMAVLQKTLRSLDLKIVAFLIQKYVLVVNNEEPTDAPPAPGFYTPDGGHTWISVTIDHTDNHFRFNKLLALLCETNRDLFYQLLATRTVTTQSLLEEDSYQDKSRRLSSEGIPDEEYAATVFSFATLAEIEQLYKAQVAPHLELQVSFTPAILFDDFAVEPFTSCIARAKDSEVVLQEYTLLLNAGIVRYHVDFSDIAAVKLTGEKLKGAINIALQRASAALKTDPQSLVDGIGLQPLLKYGLAILQEIRKEARSVKNALAGNVTIEPWQEVLLDLCTRPFPSAPEFALELNSAGQSLPTGETAIQSEIQVERVKEYLSRAKN